MSKYPFFWRSILLPLAIVLIMALTMTAQTQVPGREAAALVGVTQADGGNVVALTLTLSAAAAEAPRESVRNPARAGDDPRLAVAPGDLILRGGDGGVPLPDGAAAAKEINESAALEQQWQKDVQNTIGKARSQVVADPDKALAMIRQTTSDLAVVSELRPEMRDRLMAMLHTASREIKQRMEEFTLRQQRRIQEEMAHREQEMVDSRSARTRIRSNSCSTVSTC